MRGCRGGVSPCAGLGGSPSATYKTKRVSGRDASHPAMETAGSFNSTGSRQRKRVKGRCPLRGCRGGVSPCAGPGGSPGVAQSTRKREKKRVSERLRSSPRWKRQIDSTPGDCASGKGSRGETPCFGSRGGVSPCAGMSRQPSVPFQTKRVSEQALKAAHVGNGRWAQLQGNDLARYGRRGAGGERPHLTSLRSANFP